MRRLFAVLLLGYCVFLAWVLLNPSAAAPSATVHDVAAALHRLGLPSTLVTPSRVEFVLNAAMFASLTMLTTLIWPFSWTHWVAWAFVLSAGVELCQGLFLPARSAQFVDVVANTLGALAGAWAMSLAGVFRRSDPAVPPVVEQRARRNPATMAALTVGGATRWGSGMTQGVTVVLDSEERPWGSWHVIDVGEGYKVKRIHVNPDCRLSYQTHEHRSEHWVVIQGTATCTIDDVDSEVRVGGRVDVAQGAKHRIANAHGEELVIVEVQLGGYTGEDDIVRIEDDYGR